MLLIQNWGFTDALHWNDPAWSISCELAAYLLFPWLVAAVDWRRWSGAALIGVAAALLALLHFAMGGAPSLGVDIPRYGLIRCLTEFGTGTILAAVFLRGPRVGIVLAIATALAFAWAAGLPETLAAPATFAGLLLALALTSGASGHPLEGRWLHGLGEVSYATYLSHFLLWKLFKLVAVRDAAAVPVWGVALYCVLVLAASVLLYRCVERPAQRWINTRGVSPGMAAA